MSSAATPAVTKARFARSARAPTPGRCFPRSRSSEVATRRAPPPRVAVAAAAAARARTDPVFLTRNDAHALRAFQNRQSQHTISVLFLLTFPIALLLYPFTAGALYRAATSLAAGNVETIVSVLGGAARRYFGIFGNRFLWGCVIAGSVFIVTIPVVIWVLVRWAVSLPAL